MIIRKKIKLLLHVSLSVLLSLFVVFFAGKYYFEKWYLDMVSSRGEESATKIIIQSPEKVEVVQDLRVKSVLEQVQPSMLSIYRKKKTGKDIVSQVYKQDDLIGYGTVLTSDGWLVTVGNLDGLKASQIVVNYQGELISIEQFFIDNATTLSFLKINFNNLPVVKFGLFDDLSAGAQLLVINDQGIQLTNLSNKYYDGDDLLYSSEEYYRRLLLAGKDFVSGSSVIDFQGNLLGIIIDDDKPIVIPINFLQKSFKIILENDKIIHPYLGVYFLDIASSIGLNKQVTKGLSFGALLYGRGSVRAISSNSPVSGLLTEGVVITSVSGIKIDKQNTLSELILRKKSGDEIELEYVKKEGKFETIKVKLK